MMFPLMRYNQVTEVEQVVVIDFSEKRELDQKLAPQRVPIPVQSASSHKKKEPKEEKKSSTSSKALHTSQKPRAATNSSRIIQESSEVKAISQPARPSADESALEHQRKDEALKLAKFKSLVSQVKDVTDDNLTGERTAKPASSSSKSKVNSDSSGSVSGQIGNRSVLFTPSIKDDSQKKGKVVIKICVNGAGKVTRAEYTQAGSTTSDTYLIQLATDGVKKYLFSASDNAEECGRVVVDFQLK